MVTSEKFCLRWNDFESNISGAFREIREEKDFFDCTLSCGSRQIQAHKLILSACSPFFRSILRQNPHQHPLLYLKGVQFTDLQAVLNFMYHGEVNVAQEELNSFLSVAEDLQVKGLTQNNSGTAKSKAASAPTAPPPPKSRPPRVEEDHPHPLPSYQHQEIDHDDIQEVLSVVKTEPEHHQHTPPVTHGGPLVGSVVASMDDCHVEEDGYDYGGYEGGGQGDGFGVYEGYESHEGGTSTADTNKDCLAEGMIQYANGQYQCAMCGRGFPLKITCRRHVKSVHSDNQQVLCHICNKYMKNSGTLKAHLRGTHGIYQGGKSK